MRQRAGVARVFCKKASPLRLVRPSATGIDEEWFEGARHLNMELLQKQCRLQAVAKDGHEVVV